MTLRRTIFSAQQKKKMQKDAEGDDVKWVFYVYRRRFPRLLSAVGCVEP